jgi:hypothetical protein
VGRATASLTITWGVKLPVLLFVAGIRNVSFVLLGFRTPSAVCVLGRWYVHRFAGYIDKPDLAASICQWNCPNESVRRSVVGKKWFAACLVWLALNFGTCLDPIWVKPVRSSRASSEVAGPALE